jgi:hypothetical protein
MAIIVDQNKKKAEIDPNKAMTPATTIGSAVAPQTPAQQKTPSSGQFTNLKNYLQGNVKAGQNIASKLLGTVEPAKAAAEKNIQETQKAGQDIDTQAEKFKQGAQAVSSFLTPGSTETSFQNPQTAFNTSQLMSGQVDTGLGTTQQKASQAATNLATLAEKSRMLAGETGRQELLKNLFNNPNYRTGLSNLDQAFLQQQAGQQLQQATTGLKQFQTQKTSDLSKYLTEAQQRSQAFGQTAAETSKKLQEQLGKSAEEIDTAQQKQLSDINAKVARTNELVTQWSAGNLDPVTLNEADKALLSSGLNASNIKSYAAQGQTPTVLPGKLGVDVNPIMNPYNYLTWGAEKPIQVTQGEQYGLKDVTSEAEAKRINALRQLSGGGDLLKQYQGLTGADESQLTAAKAKLDTSNIEAARNAYYQKKQDIIADVTRKRDAERADLARQGYNQYLFDKIYAEEQQNRLNELAKTITTLRRK